MHPIRILILLLLFSAPALSLLAQQSPPQTQIMLLGCAHFGQEEFYKDKPLADLFQERRQQELKLVRAKLATFNPDLILIEQEAKEQPTVDSLYSLYKADKLDLKKLAYGRAERYQIAFALGKQLNLDRIYGIDFYDGTSNRILNQGQRIDYYQNELKAFAELGRVVTASFSEGKTTLADFLNTINSPDLLQQTYHALFVTPAKVRNGKLNTQDATLDSTRISYDYVGADFTAHFYKRELRIYANIVATQLTQKKQRILVVMGQRHAAVLKKILENDPDYQLVPVANYLK